MTSKLKNILGSRFTFQLREFKYKWFPNQNQKDYMMREGIEDKKRQDFYATFLKSNDLCFDVGANVGNRIRPILEIGCKVVAIEPQESCYKYLGWKFGKRIEIVTKGLAEKESVKTFHIADDATLSTFSDEWLDAVKDGRFKERKWDREEKIEMTTLDNLIKQFGSPKFIKIDVEGYELEVLKGLTNPVDMISFEYTVPEQIDKVIQCIDQIAKYNPEAECNYSIGESMEFELKTWLPVNEMKKFVFEDAFKNTVFGDVYVRSKSNKG